MSDQELSAAQEKAIEALLAAKVGEEGRWEDFSILAMGTRDSDGAERVSGGTAMLVIPSS